MQKIMLIGNLGADAQLKEVNGQQLIEFRMAVTEYWRDAAGTKRERTEWYKCVRWISQHEGTGVLQYLKKGQKVYVEGNPGADAYINDRKEVVAQLTVKITRGGLHLLGSVGSGAASSTAAPGGGGSPAPVSTTAAPGGTAAPQQPQGEPDNDLPF